ncbi:MAG: hypothetical protein MUF64_23365 [Polyangiaceae bacterium]|jgi:hypothetical protein|nr:hypothetical protein [Polyangiaceae bacterium]
MRGSLIFAFLAELHRLDTQATAADPDGAGPLTAGYDPDFKEPVLVDPDDDGLGQSTRREHPAVQVPCQVEPEVFEALSMFASGNSPSSQVKLVFHFRDLERMALVDPASGDALVRVWDRLGALFDRGGALVQRIRTPPGLYVTEARPIGFGLFRPRPQRNLLLVTFEPRRVAALRLSP